MVVFRWWIQNPLLVSLVKYGVMQHQEKNKPIGSTGMINLDPTSISVWFWWSLFVAYQKFSRYSNLPSVSPPVPPPPTCVRLSLTSFPFFFLAETSVHIPQLGTGDFSNSSQCHSLEKGGLRFAKSTHRHIEKSYRLIVLTDTQNKDALWVLAMVVLLFFKETDCVTHPRLSPMQIK